MLQSAPQNAPQGSAQIYARFPPTAVDHTMRRRYIRYMSIEHVVSDEPAQAAGYCEDCHTEQDHLLACDECGRVVGPCCAGDDPDTCPCQTPASPALVRGDLEG